MRTVVEDRSVSIFGGTVLYPKEKSHDVDDDKALFHDKTNILTREVIYIYDRSSKT